MKVISLEKILVIPDIHGRSFWKKALKTEEYQHVVFLGDYLDPYAYEDLDFSDGIEQLEEVISFKLEHPQNTTLLLGNHDLSYLFPSEIEASRHDYWNEDLVRRMLREHLDCFQLAFLLPISGRQFLFSHAGIHPGWVNSHADLFGADTPLEELVVKINRLLQEGSADFVNALGEVSEFRCGPNLYGSMIWADVDEYEDLAFPSDIYQVFGHTQQSEFPVITAHYACLDCRKAFTISTENGEICEAEVENATIGCTDSVIFLDIDGVMHSDHYDYTLLLRQSFAYDEYGPLFDPECVQSLKSTIDETGANIVISSSWKEDMDLSDFQEMWQQRFLPGKVIGTTPNTDYIRGMEIKSWLEANHRFTRYVILDDMSQDDFLQEQIQHFVPINANRGLDAESAKRAIELLKSREPYG